MTTTSLWPNIIRQIGYISLNVHDLSASLEHATQVLGLREVERRDGAIYLTCNQWHHALVLRAADTSGVSRLGFQATSYEALEELHTRLDREGVKILSTQPDQPGIGHSLRFVGPGGHCFEVYDTMEGGQPEYNSPGIRPRKLGHVTLKCEDMQEMHSFLERVLGFRLSDSYAKGEFLWLRCNPFHHTIGLIHGRNQLHHYDWDVENWSDLERLGDHLLANKKAFIWGPGRHGPGNNLFTYHLDPAGVCVEYSADMFYVEDESTYQWREWPEVPTSLNQWGPPPPSDFLELGTDLVPPHTEELSRPSLA